MATQSNSQVVSPTILPEIRRRARRVKSDRLVAAAIFEAIRDAGLELQSVTLDEMKDLVVEAVRAFRHRQPQHEFAA